MAATKAASRAEPQTIEQLQHRYSQLHRQQIEADANLKNAQKHLEALREEARQKYQTDDLDTLRQKLADMKQENERKRKEYQDKLDRIEAELEAVEQNFSGNDSTREDDE
jgi:hypothetical protein